MPVSSMKLTRPRYRPAPSTPRASARLDEVGGHGGAAIGDRDAEPQAVASAGYATCSYGISATGTTISLLGHLASTQKRQLRDLDGSACRGDGTRNEALQARVAAPAG
jgi:hypothetical protein